MNGRRIPVDRLGISRRARYVLSLPFGMANETERQLAYDVLRLIVELEEKERRPVEETDTP